MNQQLLSETLEHNQINFQVGIKCHLHIHVPNVIYLFYMHVKNFFLRIIPRNIFSSLQFKLITYLKKKVYILICHLAK